MAGGTAPGAYVVEVDDNAVGTTFVNARLITNGNGAYTTNPAGAPANASVYAAPAVPAKNTPITITVTAFDRFGRACGTKTVVILVSP